MVLIDDPCQVVLIEPMDDATLLDFLGWAREAEISHEELGALGHRGFHTAQAAQGSEARGVGQWLPHSMRIAHPVCAVNLVDKLADVHHRSRSLESHVRDMLLGYLDEGHPSPDSLVLTLALTR